MKDSHNTDVPIMSKETVNSPYALGVDMKFAFPLCLAIMIFTGTAAGELYKCPGPEGKLSFTDVPCNDGERSNNGTWISVSEEERKAREERERKQRENIKAAQEQKARASNQNLPGPMAGPSSKPESSGASRGTYSTPPCYATDPPICTFNAMTLALCNEEGRKSGADFSGGERTHIPGGNSFLSSDGKKTCVVNHVKGTEPADYEVRVTR